MNKNEPINVKFSATMQLPEGSSTLVVKFNEEPEERVVISTDTEGTATFYDAFGEVLLVFTINQPWEREKINEALDYAWKLPNFGHNACVAYLSTLHSMTQMLEDQQSRENDDEDSEVGGPARRPTLQ